MAAGLHLFEQELPQQSINIDKLLQPLRDKQPQPESSLNCVHCHYRITHPSERIDIDSQHSHTFSNPSGLSFRIGCFAHADGVIPEGESTAYWSWFPGYHWCVVLCRQCSLHLGWRFDNGATFYGLILNRLIEQPTHEQQ